MFSTGKGTYEESVEAAPSLCVVAAVLRRRLALDAGKFTEPSLSYLIATARMTSTVVVVELCLSQRTLLATNACKLHFAFERDKRPVTSDDGLPLCCVATGVRANSSTTRVATFAKTSS